MSEKLGGNLQRLDSIDALRGFDMLMIAGGGAFIHLLEGKTEISVIDTIAGQFVHPAWHGFSFYDFIFPLFLFLAGTSLAFSIRIGLAKGLSYAQLRQKTFKRMVILIFLGILDKNVPLDIFSPDQIRYGSVLGRIGLATFVGLILYLNFNWKQRVGIGLGVLFLYYLAMILIPIPGFGRGDLSFEGNLVGWFDRTFMPGRLLQKTYDELALLTQFPAICITLFGTIAGDILIREQTSLQKVSELVWFGLIGIVAGLLWSLVFPINKHLWSSSFILLTSGMSFLMMAFFYLLVDVLNFKKLVFPLKVIGMNSIVIYLGVRFIDFNASSKMLFSGFYKYAPEHWHVVFNTLGGLVLVWLCLYFLYKKRIFIKV